MANTQQDSGEKTEQPTPKRREDSRRKGSVARSAEVNSAVILLFSLLVLQVGGSAMAARLSNVARMLLARAGSLQITTDNLQGYALSGMSIILMALLPLALGIMIIGIAASAAQVGFHFSGEVLRPKFTRMNPLSGLKRIMLSKQSLVELLKSLMKVAVIGVVAYNAVRGLLEESVTLADGDPTAILAFLSRSALALGMNVGGAFLAIAALDYGFQRYEHEQQLKMTKQEVKEESKMQEGDPQIKGRIRGIQRQIAYKRMMHDVPKADVVVTNPTHVAVALKYDSSKMHAPKVVAKGAELIAKRIREIAREHGVPIVEDRMLARTLYKSVEVGQEIPEKLFHAVAQLLAYIFRVKSMNAGLAARSGN